MKMKMKAYTTGSEYIGILINRLYKTIERTKNQDYPKQGFIIASHDFLEPYPHVKEMDLITLAVLDLLIQFVYPSIAGYGKFTIVYTMKQSYGENITFTIGTSIPLTTEKDELIPMSEIRAHISKLVRYYAEKYEGELLVRVTVRAYLCGEKKERTSISEEERYGRLSSILQSSFSELEPLTAREREISKRKSPTYISRLKKARKEMKPFIVADIETLIEDNIHKPYAAGLMVVRPNEDLDPYMIETYYSEDHSIFMDNFEERSTQLLYDFVCRISNIVEREKSPLTIYFHNFSRFDGIIILKHIACHHKSYELKPLMRNHRLYELAIKSGKKVLFRFRDSLNLLPGKLVDLAKNLCPDLGTKGSIDHENVSQSTLVINQESYITYLKQDILLLGGVMKRAQEIYWEVYNVDIESKITLSSLALSIFRMKYYDISQFPIHIPNQNEDTFIRHGYYGGHADAYKPYGQNLYYYDVNSLYPFVMKEFQMPGGVPVWHGNLGDKEIESLFGFVEAYVVCPKNIKKPFLPYRDKDKMTLIFPTGEFVGVYFSEELKYAKSIGYTVRPISGYLFERKESPFKSFVSSLYESRLEAKKEGNDAMSYVYKILMNSLYGRFGINPKSTITEVCNIEQFHQFIRHSDFISGDMLSDDTYIVSYHSNNDPNVWKPMKNAAVQLAAAITAYARIHMYPYISRDDCYYTDTDSVVLGNPLPQELISSNQLGMFKLEDRVVKGYFLAPKAYLYTTASGKNVLKYKGTAKSMITPEWFEEQFANPSRTQTVEIISNFRIDWNQLHIMQKHQSIRTGLTLGSKRMPLYENQIWVDTDPIDVFDLSSINRTGHEIVISLNKENKELKQLQELKDKEIQELKERLEWQQKKKEIGLEWKQKNEEIGLEQKEKELPEGVEWMEERGQAWKDQELPEGLEWMEEERQISQERLISQENHKEWLEWQQKEIEWEKERKQDQEWQQRDQERKKQKDKIEQIRKQHDQELKEKKMLELQQKEKERLSKEKENLKDESEISTYRKYPYMRRNRAERLRKKKARNPGGDRDSPP